MHRRMAVERELDKNEINLGNIIFDESGYIILYSTMLGVKMVNIYTNRCIKIMGKPENIRPMQLALFQVFQAKDLQLQFKHTNVHQRVHVTHTRVYVCTYIKSIMYIGESKEDHRRSDCRDGGL